MSVKSRQGRQKNQKRKKQPHTVAGKNGKPSSTGELLPAKQIDQLPAHHTTGSLRAAALLRIQKGLGNAHVQRSLRTSALGSTVQCCRCQAEAGCNCPVNRSEEQQAMVEKTADSVIQRDDNEAPIDTEREEAFQLEVNPDLIEANLNLIRGRHRFSGRAELSEPVSLALDALDINPGFDPSQLQLSLNYNNECNEALQSALLGFSMGPFINVDRIPWQARARAGIRIGGMRLEPGVGIGFQGTDFDSLLFTLSLAQTSQATPSECIAPPSDPSQTPAEEPTNEPPATREPPTPQDEPPTSTTETSTTLPAYTLYFFYDSSLIRPKSNDDFQAILDLLRMVPSLVVHLTGHTSLEGSDRYNQTLSEERVQAIKDRLVMGQIDPNRIHTLAMGETAPAVPEPDNQQRSLHPAIERVRTLNRRVEVHFFDPSGRFDSAPLELSDPEVSL